MLGTRRHRGFQYRYLGARAALDGAFMCYTQELVETWAAFFVRWYNGIAAKYPCTAGASRGLWLVEHITLYVATFDDGWHTPIAASMLSCPASCARKRAELLSPTIREHGRVSVPSITVSLASQS